jgi:hypothetical protein
LSSIEGLVTALRARHGIDPDVSELEDRHLLSSHGRVVYVCYGEKGDWLYGLVGAPHHHSDDNVLRDHFIESVAALLTGEKACAICP